MEEGVAPTDCRLRPDQRLMEEGRWEEANAEKVRLEEKQRAVRREKECAVEKAAEEGMNNSYYGVIVNVGANNEHLPAIPTHFVLKPKHG